MSDAGKPRVECGAQWNGEWPPCGLPRDHEGAHHGKGSDGRQYIWAMDEAPMALSTNGELLVEPTGRVYFEPESVTVQPAPESMHGAADEFGGTDYPDAPAEEPRVRIMRDSNGNEYAVVGPGMSLRLHDVTFEADKLRARVAELERERDDWHHDALDAWEDNKAVEKELDAAEAKLAESEQRVENLNLAIALIQGNKAVTCAWCHKIFPKPGQVEAAKQHVFECPESPHRGSIGPEVVARVREALEKICVDISRDNWSVPHPELVQKQVMAALALLPAESSKSERSEDQEGA